MHRIRDLLRRGDPMVLLTAGGLTTTLILLVGMLVLVLSSGTGVFWPSQLTEWELADGRKFLGPQVGYEAIRGDGTEASPGNRVNIKTGNRDLHGIDFKWVDEADIVGRSVPESAVHVERIEWGAFHGYLRSVRTPEGEAAASPEGLWDAAIEAIDEVDEPELDTGAELVFATADGDPVTIHAGEVFRIHRPNAMGTLAKTGHYLAGVAGFITGTPRESNTEGGIFPALFGTCLMVLIMSIAVMPLGVMAAVYLHEYAKQGPLVRTIRIAVSNLAGVPSIVFGLFGLGFFVYTMGGAIDQTLFSGSLPTPTFGTGGILWASLTLALLTLPVVIVATEESLTAVPMAAREGALALGATKWQTIKGVVLPSSGPGILTGLILAVARGAGEVAPLMLTGAVAAAPELPLDGAWPFLHFDRKFMHLGFHIYDLGFQSPNVEAAKPMVYATTLLLIGLVVVLNVTAIVVRARMRKKLSGSAF